MATSPIAITPAALEPARSISFMQQFRADKGAEKNAYFPQGGDISQWREGHRPKHQTIGQRAKDSDGQTLKFVGLPDLSHLGPATDGEGSKITVRAILPPPVQ
jgi:hypothetical protein